MVSASDILRERRPAEGLCVVGASAGSGKTHHLTEVVVHALQGSEAPALDVESVVAVTYTTRAASELRSRIRQTLVGQGESESALRLPLARLGTVHAVCLSWLQDFAIDAGLPPGVQVLPDDGGLQFRRLLETSIPAELQARLTKVAKGLQINWDGKRSRTDWMWRVFELIDLARANRIRPSALAQMAARSVAQMQSLLPPASSRDLDAALLGAIGRAEQDLAASDDKTKATNTVRNEVRAVGRRLRTGWATWKDWATLAALEPAKKSAELVTEVREVAADLEAHPRFQSELREMILGVFECARIGLERYQSHKTRLRLVDYVDMLEHALGLLEQPEIAGELAGHLRLLVVDEFQDTSPIQLELFLRLHQLTQRSIWVGDRKQCIFEFAGADPQLMDSVARWAARNGGQAQQLPSNYRSRPELVDLCSELFARALERHGYARDEVVVTSRRGVPAALEPLPPLGVFMLCTGNAEETARAIALGVQRLLAEPERTSVVDRRTGVLRPLQPGDVAVLVRTNTEAEAIARELGRLRIRPALARPGLLHTPEGTLIDAALSYLVDRADGVAAATLDALHGFGDVQPDEWLAGQIRRHQGRKEAAKKAPVQGHAGAVEPAEVSNEMHLSASPGGWRAALDALALQDRQMSPRETVDAVLHALDAERRVLGWPDPEQRSGNLDALRALADHYEDTCRVTGAAASLAGMLYYFDQAREARWNGSEVRATDDQHFCQGPGAVVLCTYHRAKGLEWPVVILASLDAGPRTDAFGVKIQGAEGELDPQRPLEGRWIRYLPRPLSNQSKNLGFVEREQQSWQGIEARLDEQRERARLLYVGFTRARDHLILAVRRKNEQVQAKWLEELRASDGEPLLRVPIVGEGLHTLTVAGTNVRTRIWEVDPEQARPVPQNDTSQPLTWRRPPASPPRAPFALTPSNVMDDWAMLPRLQVREIVRLGSPLAVQRSGTVDWAAFGTTVHAFLAADRHQDMPAVRLERARRLLHACDSGATVEPAALIAMGDALHGFVDQRWPSAVWHREVPVRARVGTGATARRVNGTIDLLLETDSGYVVIDHKTFGDPREQAIRAEAEGYLTQLAAYGEALAVIGGKRVEEYWLHLGVVGAWVGCEYRRTQTVPRKAVE
ncbi:MAG TPA: UvrD-helicase domain-containing protein [Polyangiaceae bacterium]|nr:UvrD-helicase domain-containing protein [Polyangiaceae bacterium]